MQAILCAKGHSSTERDYCSECGARIEGSSTPDGASQSSPAAYPGEICPDCGTLREEQDRGFCEVCGFNFLTGAHGEIPMEAAPIPASENLPQRETAPAMETTARWRLTVSLDSSLRFPESPEPPADFVSASMDLDGTALLIGREDIGRGIHPEVALPFDEAVSRRHALLHRAGADAPWLLRDVGASNGTRLNGKALSALTDYALEDGDEITLGHWSRLRLERQ